MWELKNQRGLENQVTSNLNPEDRGEKTEPIVRFGFHIKANFSEDSVLTLDVLELSINTMH